MNDIGEHAGEHLRRDLNGEEGEEDLDDLEQQYDRQADAADLEKLVSDLLFAVQGLGSVKHLNGIEIYVKGPHCEDSIKDLIRLVRRDDPEDPVSRRKLLVWKTFENDLMQLLLTQFQDKKLAFYLILLMVNLSEQPVKTCASKNELRQALSEYKLAFLKPQAIGTLMQHLGDCIESSTRGGLSKVHEQMIEMIIILLKNLLVIRDAQVSDCTSNEVLRNLHFHFICQMRREHCFDLLIFLTQDFAKLDVLKKLDIVFLEIFYHVFSSFDPVWLVSQSAQSELKTLIEKDRSWKRKIADITPTRHTRFQADFRFKRLFDDTKKLTTNPFSEGGDINVTKHQMQKPVQRKLIQQTDSIFRKRLHMEVRVEMPLDNPLAVSGRGQQQSEEEEEEVRTEFLAFKGIMAHFALEFVKFSFCPLMEQCYNLLYSESEKLEPSDVQYYFVLLAFGLKMARIMIFENKQTELEIVDVAVALQLTQFQLIFSKLVKEVTQKKKVFSLKNLYSTVLVFHELLLIVKAMSLDNNLSNRKNSQIIQQNIFHHDVTKALRIALDLCQRGVLQDVVLKTMVELVAIFFDLLDNFSKGKVLTLQTDKLVKKKKKLKGQQKKRVQTEEGDGLEDFLEKDDQEDDESNDNEDYEEGSSQKKERKEKKKKEKKQVESQQGSDEDEEDEDAPHFQERQYNMNSEFAILAEYAILEKVLFLISAEKVLSNSPELNEAVFKFIARVSNNLSADWLFYQLDFLAIFQAILAHPEIKMRIENRKLVELIKRILKKMFDLLKTNQLLVVEMLFRFPDYSVKNSILSNYANLEEEKEEKETEELLDPLDAFNDKQQLIEERKTWREEEDSVLIKNFSTFKDLESVYDQLTTLLHGNGQFDKTPEDVRKRVRYFKLHKSQSKAESIFKEIYASNKMKLAQAVEKLAEKQASSGNVSLLEVQLLTDSIFVNFKDYLQTFEQVGDKMANRRIVQESSEMTNLERLLLMQDFAIVPMIPRHFDLIEMVEVKAVFEGLGLKEPIQGQHYWRVPGHFTLSQVDTQLEKLQQCIDNPFKARDDVKAEQLKSTELKEEEKKVRTEQKQNEKRRNYNRKSEDLGEEVGEEEQEKKQKKRKAIPFEDEREVEEDKVSIKLKANEEEEDDGFMWNGGKEKDDGEVGFVWNGNDQESEGENEKEKMKGHSEEEEEKEKEEKENQMVTKKKSKTRSLRKNRDKPVSSEIEDKVEVEQEEGRVFYSDEESQGHID